MTELWQKNSLLRNPVFKVNSINTLLENSMSNVGVKRLKNFSTEIFIPKKVSTRYITKNELKIIVLQNILCNNKKYRKEKTIWMRMTSCRLFLLGQMKLEEKN